MCDPLQCLHQDITEVSRENVLFTVGAVDLCRICRGYEVVIRRKLHLPPFADSRYVKINSSYCTVLGFTVQENTVQYRVF